MRHLKCHVDYSSHMLIYTFCSGVVKDREAPFSLNYVRLKNYKNLSSYVIPHSLISVSFVELTFSRNLTRLKYYANWINSPNSHISFIRMQSLSKTLKSLKRNQMFF